MNKIIFTDLDGTLTFRDTYNLFIFHNLTLSSVLKNSVGLTLMAFRYIFGLLSKEGVKRASFKMFFDGYDTTKNIDKFIENIPWNRDVIEQINKKKDEGYSVILVTAAPDLYLEHICKYLDYDGFLATKTLRDGNCTVGLFDGKVCNFDEKTRRIEEFLDGEKTVHTISYGNSSGDFDMLNYCDESYFVKRKRIKNFNSAEFL